MNLEKELQNQFDLIDSGATMQINRDEDGFIRARVNPMPYLRSPMRQAQPQSLEQTIDELPTVLGGAAGGAVAGSLGGLQDIFGLIYGAGKGMAAEEGQKMQTFLDTATEISDKYGSGAVKGFIRDKAKEAGLDEEKMALLDEAMMVGEFGGIGGLAKGAVTAAPKVVEKGLDAVETLGSRARQQLAEGGETLFSGAPIDDAVNKGFAAAGDAVAKFRAPTEKEPGVIAFHGSGADFDEFKLEKIGTGEGAQAYGYGLYFTDSESIAKFYRDTVGDKKYIKTEYTDNNQAAQSLPKDVPFDDVDGYRSYDINDTNSVLNSALQKTDLSSPLKSSFINNFKKQGAITIPMKDGSYLTLLKNQDGTRFTATPMQMSKGTMYKVGLEPKPEDMLDYQGTFADQPKNVQDALKAIGYAVDVDESGKKLSERGVELAVSRPMPVILDAMKGRIYSQIAAGKQSPGPADKILSEKLLEQGVPGIKYRAAGSRGASVDSASAEYNYVIFDDKMIKILEKYGIVGPVAITGIAASQQEGESDGQSS